MLRRSEMVTREILSEDAQIELNKLQSFVAGAPKSDTFYSFFVNLAANVGSSEHTFCLYVTRRRIRALDENIGSDDEEESSSRWRANVIGILPMIRTMVACATWTHGKFVFEYGGAIVPSLVPILDCLMFEMFLLLRFSRSLSSLEIEFNRHSQVHVRPLLSSDLSIETLILTPGAMELPYHAESIPQYFLRNSVLKSCTLGLDSCDFKLYPQLLEIILCPFARCSQGVGAPNRTIENSIGALGVIRR